jgi:hypothetical protein
MFMHFDTPDGAGPDQFMLGDRLMVAPVLEQGVTRRRVWLPPGTWTHWLTGQTYAGGPTIAVDAPLGMTPIFVRDGTALFVAEPGRNADETLRNPLSLEVHPPSLGAVGSGSLFLDDGESDLGARFVLDVNVRAEESRLCIGLERREQSFVPRQREFEVVLPPGYRSLSIDGVAVGLRPSGTAVDGRGAASVKARVPLSATEILCA